MAPPSTRRRPRRRRRRLQRRSRGTRWIPGLQKRPRDLDLPPWLKGRYGTAVGRAVHGVLQTIDLATGAGLDDAVAAQCQAEAVPDRADDVRAPGRGRARLGGGAGRRRPPALARGVRLHADRRPAAGGLRRPALPGRRRPGRRRPQDVRRAPTPTTSIAGWRAIDCRVPRTRWRSVGPPASPSSASCSCSSPPHGAVERDLGDLPAAMADVERLVAEGAELVTP